MMLNYRKTKVSIIGLNRYALAFIFVLSLSSYAYTQTISQTPKTTVSIDDVTVLPSFGTRAGTWFFHLNDTSSQVLLMGFNKGGIEQQPNYELVTELNPSSDVTLTFPSYNISTSVSLRCLVKNTGTVDVSVGWFNDESNLEYTNIIPGQEKIIELKDVSLESSKISFKIRSPEFTSSDTNEQRCSLTATHFQYNTSTYFQSLSLDPVRKEQSFEPIATSPNFRSSLASALIEWDWRMQDGIGTEREPRTYLQSLELRLPQGRALLEDLQKAVEEESYESLVQYDPEISTNFESLSDTIEQYLQKWSQLEENFSKLLTTPDDLQEAKRLWLQVHEFKRHILINSPYFKLKSLVFIKSAPTIMSHQLTQVYGYTARPGGGIYTLDAPNSDNELMLARNITPTNLPIGAYMTPELSFNAQDLYFSFCATPSTPQLWRDENAMKRRFHLYKMALNAPEYTAQRLTDGDYDDFAPILLPNDDLVFCSTRRGGFHRCGGGPCYVYTLTHSKGDGSEPKTISFHETNEWFPTLAHNGRIIYTRWDYVDRDAVYYQQLWSARQDGTDVRIFYGNNTFNPPGMWEAKATPGSDKILAIAGPHHGMSAGSVFLIDTTKGVDGVEPIERLTPDVLIPEGETPLPSIPQLPTFCDFDYVPTNFWMAAREAEREQESAEERRWPVHCFKSPFPLAEKYFIASYSFDQLLGEAGPNIPNQFGIYFCDAFGNRELVYRDPNISSLWALPLRKRPIPPAVASVLDESRQQQDNPTGTFFVQNIYDSWPTKISATIKELRIVQVLPKTTPNANQPMVGAANASPGKQVLGTVPVEEDGSVFFEAPAKIPLLFQALDENGRMVQGMRSLVYLQPGESAGCTGCHEDRMATVVSAKTIASTKSPSKIKPGPDGSKPFSYPILVQPILDKNCIDCHNDNKADGGVNLTGAPEGHYTKSYNALINYVPYTYWGAPNGNFEPRTEPDRFGSRPSKLTRLLDSGHYDVTLTPQEWESLNVWQDCNALFYGTFNVDDQLKQQRGERILGPELE